MDIKVSKNQSSGQEYQDYSISTIKSNSELQINADDKIVVDASGRRWRLTIDLARKEELKLRKEEESRKSFEELKNKILRKQKRNLLVPLK